MIVFASIVILFCMVVIYISIALLAEKAEKLADAIEKVYPMPLPNPKHHRFFGYCWTIKTADANDPRWTTTDAGGFTVKHLFGIAWAELDDMKALNVFFLRWMLIVVKMEQP